MNNQQTHSTNELELLIEEFMKSPDENRAARIVHLMRLNPLFILCTPSWKESEGAFSARTIEERIEQGQADELPIFTIVSPKFPDGVLIPVFTSRENAQTFSEDPRLSCIEVDAPLIRMLEDHLEQAGGILINPGQQGLVIDRKTLLTIFHDRSMPGLPDPDVYLDNSYEDGSLLIEERILDQLRKQGEANPEINALWLLVHDDPDPQRQNWLIVLDVDQPKDLGDFHELAESFLSQALVPTCGMCFSRVESVAPLLETIDPVYIRLLN